MRAQGASPIQPSLAIPFLAVVLASTLIQSLFLTVNLAAPFHFTVLGTGVYVRVGLLLLSWSCLILCMLSKNK